MPMRSAAACDRLVVALPTDEPLREANRRTLIVDVSPLATAPSTTAIDSASGRRPPNMRTAARKPIRTRTLAVVLWAFAAAAGCDGWRPGGTTYQAGHGIVVWHPEPERGGFLPWAFRVATPDSGVPYLVLERVGSSAGAEVLAEAPLPAGAKEVLVRLDFERRQRAVLRVARGTPIAVAAPLPLCCGNALAASPRDLPQDSAGAIVLQYAVSERLAASESASFEAARRLEHASYLRLRFGVRP